MQQGLDSIQGSSGQGYFLKGLPRQGKGAGDTASLLQLAMEGKRNDLAVHSTWGLALSQNSVVLSLFYFSFPPFWYSVFLAQIFHASGFAKTKTSKGCVSVGAR